MNKLRLFLTWGLLLAVTHVMGYTISVEPIVVEPGGSADLIINLSNTETDLTAYQLSLFLPEGVTVQKKPNGKYAYTENADRHDGNFTITLKDAANGSILIACFSADKDVLTGSSGELIRLPLEVASTVTTAQQGSIGNIEFTDVNAQAYRIADVEFTISVEETPPTPEVTVSVPDVEVTSGGTADLIVNMGTERTDLTAYQLSLFLPEGVTVQKNPDGKYAYTPNADRHNGNFNITVKDAANGSILIACSGGESTILLSEDFSKVTTSSTNVITTFDTYTQISGWSGEKVFPDNGQVRIGSASSAGSIQTPAVSATGPITVVWNARRWPRDNTSIYIGVSEDNGNTFREEQVSLADDLTQYSKTFTITSNSVIVRWRSSGNSKQRFYLDDISITGVGSNSSEVLTGSSGELIRLPIEVASTVTTSQQGSLGNIEFTDVNAQAYRIADVEFTISVEETPPTPEVTVSVPDVEVTSGGTANLIVNMETERTDLTAYQLSLFLPEGVTVQKKSNGKYAYTANADRHDGNFTFTVKDAANGSILIACFSADKDVLTGSSGELIRLPIEVASTVTSSQQGSIGNIEFTDVNAQAYRIADVGFTISVEEAPVTPEVIISVPDVEVTAGGTADLIVNMETQRTDLTAYQLSLFLPEGVTVQKKANGKYAYTANAERHDGNFTVTVKDAANGSILIACFSADKDVLTGSSGELIRLPIEVASTVTASQQGSIGNIEFTDVNAHAYRIADVEFNISIAGYQMGDVNGNGQIDIGDAVCIVNYLVNKLNSVFIEVAADLNGNNQIDIGDAVMIVNILVGKDNDTAAPVMDIEETTNERDPD